MQTYFTPIKNNTIKRWPPNTVEKTMRWWMDFIQIMENSHKWTYNVVAIYEIHFQCIVGISLIFIFHEPLCLLQNVIVFCKHINIFVFGSKTRRDNFAMDYFIMNDSRYLLGMFNWKNLHTINIPSKFLYLVLLQLFWNLVWTIAPFTCWTTIAAIESHFSQQANLSPTLFFT